MIPEIDPKRLYSFAEAARLIPSCHAGKGGISTHTLHNWRRAGAIKAHQRLQRWFIWGAELLKLFPEMPPEAEQVRSPAQRQKAYRDAEREARKRRLLVD